FAGKGYGALKSGVADAVIALLEPIQTRYKALLAEKGYLAEQIALGTQKAQAAARRTLRRVYHKLGLDA
ncbi:MAG: tryptophan--tRNA ligase, partial [Clostridia bacterium]|nr:tryptophan--tRNA ligase [Clostridia bacterium]